jgi:serine/threonine-protein kinase
MSNQKKQGRQHLPLDVLARIDQICDRFEAERDAGKAPRVEVYLGLIDEQYRPVLESELRASEGEARGQSGESSTPARTQRALLFGVLGYQTGLIDRTKLIDAFRAWAADKVQSVAEVLTSLGAVDDSRRTLLEALVAEHLKGHQGDVGKSLASLPAGRSTIDELKHIEDAELNATLDHLSRTAGATDDTREATRDSASFHLGVTAGDGQRYRVLRPHAKGGLGAVFVALDQELHREVALKEIQDSHADDPISRSRFLLEAEITGGLEHPGIVPVYGLGTYGDGRPFYAMRFIRGDSLKEAIERFHADETLKRDPGRRSLELRKLLRRFLDVCNAIDYAHSRGVLHRDLKPGNVIVGKHGETLVIDWGLAKALGSTGSEAGSEEQPLTPHSASGSAQTLPGSAFGTPAYMSPEQAHGQLEKLGPRSDVYSLGATLYCLLTGKAPFEGDDIGAVIRAVQEGRFPPPRKVDPKVDKALEAICLKAMALEPEKRYASCKPFADDIESWMADEPITAWHEPWTRTLLRWLTRHRTSVTAAAAAGLVALLGTAAVLAVLTQMNRDLSSALGREQSANDELSKSKLRVEATNNQLRDASARVADRFRLALDAIGLFHGEVSKDFLLKEKPFKSLRARLLRGAADFYGKLEERLQGQSDADSRAALATAYEELGNVTHEIGSKADALTVRRKALAIRRELASLPEGGLETQIRLARCLLTHSVSLSEQEDRRGSSAAKLEALALAEKLGAEGRASPEARLVLARALTLVGNDLTLRERKAVEGLKKHERAREILQDLLAHDTANVKYREGLASCECDYGITLGECVRYDECVAAFERAIAVFGELAGRDDPTSWNRLAVYHSNLGAAWEKQGRQDKQYEEKKNSLALWRKTSVAFPNSADTRSNVAFGLKNLGDLLEQMGRLDEALDTFVEARNLWKALRSEDVSGAFYWGGETSCLSRIGLILLAKGDNPGALRVCREELSCAKGWISLHPRNSQGLQWLARAHRDTGQALVRGSHPSEALRHLQEARGIDEALATASPGEHRFQAMLATDLLGLGQCYRMLGQAEAASDAMRQAISTFSAIPTPSSIVRYDFACARAALAALANDPRSGVSAIEAQVQADMALSLLRRALVPGNVYPGRLRTEPLFDSLRSRPDFQPLLLDAVFPGWPFVGAK